MAVNAVAYIEKTMPKVVDKVLAKESLTDALIGGSEIKLDFLDAKTVKITKMASTGLGAYNRGGHGQTNGKGAVQSTHETFTLSQERFSAIPLDKLDTLDDAETVFGHLATEFLRTKVVPEFDAYRFSKLADYTSETLGNKVVVSKTNLTNHIIDEFNKALKWMAEAKVPEGEMVMYVSPETMYLIRSTNELFKKLSQSEYAGKVSFAIQNYENKPIVEVPSDEFYTDISIGANGYGPKSTSKKIHFMIVGKKAPIIVKKLDWTKVYDSDQTNLGYVGYEFDNLYYHDIFVTDNMRPCIYCCVSDESAIGSANALLVDAVAGNTSNYTILKGALTMPAGIIWDKIRVETGANAPEIGATAGSGTVVGTVGVTGEQSFTEFDAHANTHTRLVAEFNGKVVAVSKDFVATLPKK